MPARSGSLAAMPYLHPTQEQIAEIAAGPEGPIVMVNLMRFTRDEAGELVGHESYLRYSEAVLPMVTAVGGKPVWGGRAEMVFIGDERDSWDSVVLVEYPSRKAFLEMAMSQEYADIHHLRTDGLETTAIIVTTPGAFI